MNDEVAKAEAAKRIYEDPLFKEALKIVREAILDQWSSTPARDVEGREWLWMLHQSANRFENVFKSWMETGELAKRALERAEKESLLQRVRSVL